MNHSHMWLCGGFAALTVLLVVVGAGAGPWSRRVDAQ